MSTTVLAQGKLVPTGLTIKGFLESRNAMTCDTTLSKAFEEYQDEEKEKVYVIDGIVYIIQGTIEEFCGDISETRKNDDGSIDYLLVYYTGGCCMEEALSAAL